MAAPNSVNLYSLEWSDYGDHLNTRIQGLFDDARLADVTLVCEGKFVKTHKFLLCLCSPYFKKLFEVNWQDRGNTIVILDNVRFTDLHNILRFIYTGRVQILQSDLNSFLKTGSRLGIEGLASCVDGSGAAPTTETMTVEAEVPQGTMDYGKAPTEIHMNEIEGENIFGIETTIVSGVHDNILLAEPRAPVGHPQEPMVHASTSGTFLKLDHDNGMDMVKDQVPVGPKPSKKRKRDQTPADPNKPPPRRFKCSFPKCEFSSKSKWNTRRHMKIHDVNVPMVPCTEPNCDKLIKEYNLDRHVQECRRKSSQSAADIQAARSKFSCKICPSQQVFKSQKALKAHMQELHRDAGPPNDARSQRGQQAPQHQQHQQHTLPPTHTLQPPQPPQPPNV